jgi:hypothetical protein
MTETDPPIASLIEFIERVFEFREKWKAADHDAKCDTKRSPTQLWFPGLPSAKYDLKPSVYRLEEPDEDEIWSGFMRQGLQLAPDIQLPYRAMSNGTSSCNTTARQRDYWIGRTALCSACTLR